MTKSDFYTATRKFAEFGKISILPFFLFLFFSCSDKEDPPSQYPIAEMDLKGYPFSFKFSLPVPNSATSRTETEEPGSDVENFIDIANNDFRILIVKEGKNTDGGDDLIVGALQFVTLESSSTDASGISYNLRGYMSTDNWKKVKGVNIKFAVLANWGEYEKIDKLSKGSALSLYDLYNQSIFNFSERALQKLEKSDNEYSQNALEEGNYIPMYGVSGNVTITNNDESPQDIGTIYLTRALAKVEVKAKEHSVKIDNVRIRRFNYQGYHLPSAFRSETTSSCDEHIPHIPTDSYEDGYVYFNYYENEDTWIVYVPEYININNTNQSSIEIKFLENEGYEPIYFCDYITPSSDTSASVRGDDFDLFRNHWYSFKIYRNLRVDVEVIQYKEVKLEPGFGFDEPFPRPYTPGENPPWVEI